MKISLVTVFLLLTISSLGSSSLGEVVELRINDKMTPPGGWAVITIRQGSEPRPVGSGRGGLMDETSGAVWSPGSLFISEPLILVENSSGELTYQIDEFGPNSVLFSFESSEADIGIDNRRPFAYIARRVNPNAVPGTQATIRFDPESTFMYNESGEPFDLRTRSGQFRVGGLSITCMNPLTDMVLTDQEVTILGVGFDPSLRTDVEFDGVRASARAINDRTIVATAPMDFLADTVEVKVRQRTPGPGRDRPRDTFVSYRFGCFPE